MKVRVQATTCLVLACSLLVTAAAEAQIGGLLRRAKRAASDELGREAEKLIREGVRCVVGDDECVRGARAEGRTPVMTDADGTILTDEDGRPITDPEKVPPATAAAAKARGTAGASAGGVTSAAEPPGTGAWVNYDFVPGEQVLFYDDYAGDRVGDFPRRFNLVAGNWEIVDWQGARYLRATANGTVEISLPETLPERFTIEFPASVQHGNAYVRVSTAPVYHGSRDYAGSLPSLEFSRAGLRSVKGLGPESLTNRRAGATKDALVAVRIMADGDYLKMYLNEQRVANVPNAVFPRSAKLFFAVSWASETSPVMLGPVRIAAGGRDLYDALERDGRVATQGILFATGSAVLRPESTPTLAQIGDILRDHPALQLAIEGHTDSEGDDASNLQLSERRAQAVKNYLVETYEIDPSRLDASGLGETRPAADNGTAEGRQQNRRVELVRQQG